MIGQIIVRLDFLVYIRVVRFIVVEFFYIFSFEVDGIQISEGREIGFVFLEDFMVLGSIYVIFLVFSYDNLVIDFLISFEGKQILDRVSLLFF